MELNDPTYENNNYNDLINDVNSRSKNGTPLYNNPEYKIAYNNLSKQKTNYQNDITMSNYFLTKLNIIKTKKNTLIQPNNEDNDKRQIEINNYYILKYKKEGDILKTLIFFCALALIGSLFSIKGLISETVYIIYLSSIFSIGLMIILFSTYNLYSRDNINFDETDFSYSSVAGTDMSYNTIDDKPITSKKNIDSETDKSCV